MMIQPDPVSLVPGVAQRIRELRQSRGWSVSFLVKKVKAARPEIRITREIIANWESGRRAAISIDELDGVAAALGIPNPWDLTKPGCKRCLGMPPMGFTCNECGVEGIGFPDG